MVAHSPIRHFFRKDSGMRSSYLCNGALPFLLLLSNLFSLCRTPLCFFDILLLHVCSIYLFSLKYSYGYISIQKYKLGCFNSIYMRHIVFVAECRKLVARLFLLAFFFIINSMSPIILSLSVST